MNSSSSTPFAGVTVRAGVAGEDAREWSAVSDPTGRFRIELDEEAVAHLLGQRRHRELTFRMYSGSGPLFLGSQNIVVSTATLRGSETLTLSTEPITGTAGFAVSGYVVQADGTPVRATVTLYRKDLRTETSLGSGTTDATGRFVIRYTVSSGFTDRADFTVRLAAVGITASVGPICNPPPDLVVRLVEGNVPYRGPSEFDLDLAALSPLVGAYSFGSITAEEVEYLQCRSDYEPAAIARLVRAHSLGGGVSAAAAYALAYAGHPLNLHVLGGLNDRDISAAIAQAVADNVVPAATLADDSATVAALKAARIDRMVPSTTPESQPLGALLVAASLTPGLPRQFAEAYAAFVGTAEDFWSFLRTRFGDTAVDRIQFTLQVGALTASHPRLVKLLHEKRDAAEFTRAAELAQFDAADWRKWLDETVDSVVVGAPDGVPGNDSSRTRDAYSVAIAAMVEDLFPSAHLAYRVPATAITSNLAAFVVANPDFSFLRTELAGFFPTAQGRPTGTEAQETLRRDLARVQRLVHITPRRGRTAHVVALLTGGAVSAREIQRMGLPVFKRRFNLDDAAAATIYDKADQVATAVNHTVLHMRPEMYVGNFKVLTTPGCGDPDLETLFGSLDYCSCKHCESVYGVAAYFVDVMQFVRDRGQGVGSLFAALTDRRPELVHVKLNCENSDTPLPTIDLVNEILEREARVPLGLAAIDFENPNNWLQTTWSAGDLAAHPEHVDDQVYVRLRDVTRAYFPMTLPFDLPLAEARAYLQSLGVGRVELQDVFEFWSAFAEDQPFRVDERLGLSRGHGRIVRAEAGTKTLEEHWGFASGADWVGPINEVERFLVRAGLTFPELQALLRTRFLDGVEIAYDEPCTLAGARLIPTDEPTEDGLEAPKLAALHVFLRVRRALGWSFAELDAALAALGVDLTTPAADLAALARLVRVRRRFPQLPLGEVLSWWGPLDDRKPAEDLRSYYDEVVRPRTREAAFRDLTGTLGEVRGSLLGILQIDEAGLQAIYSATGLDDVDSLTLPNLSTLYRVASMARAVGLSVVDLVTLTRYTQSLNEGTPGPFAGDPDAPVRELLELATAVKHSGFTVAALDWILRNQRGEAFGTSDLDVMRTLIGLITALQQTAVEHAQSLPPAELPPAERLEKLLLAVHPPVTALAALLFVRKESDPPPGTLAEAAALRDNLLPFLVEDSPAHSEFGLTFASPTTAEDRVDLALAALAAWLWQQRREHVVIQQLAVALKLEPADVADLLVSYEDSNGSALAQFTADAFFAPTAFDSEADAALLKEESFPKQFVTRPVVDVRAELYRQLRKIALIASTFRFSPGLLRWLLTHADNALTPVLDLANLPADQAPHAPIYAAFAGWDWLRRAIVLRDQALVDPAALPVLLDALFASPYVEDTALAALAAATGWDEASLDAFEAAHPLTQADLASLRGVEALHGVFRASARIGAQPATLWTWAVTPTVTVAQAAAITGTVQSKYSAPAWISAAQPIRDKLRERQRDALVDLLVHELDGVEDREDLFARLLTDVDISCCGRTTRLLFATAAVQLFVQRALMGLEGPGLTLTSAESEEWAWMKRYRVWEANRKIFLYPENWVTPELRDDKTPLFRQLEDDISKSEVTATAVEKAYVRYLEGLHEVARLDICGMYHELEEDPSSDELLVDRMHVFGRTRGDPSKVFYRQRVDDAYWTPWQELPFPVEAPDVLPVVAYRRLMLIWPKIEVRAKEPSDSELKATEDSPKNPSKYRKVRLMWSEYREGEWGDVRTTETTLRVPQYANASSPEDRHRYWDVSLTAERDGADLHVRPAVARALGTTTEVKHVLIDLQGYFQYDATTGRFEVEHDSVPEFDVYNDAGLTSGFPMPINTIPRNQAYGPPDGYPVVGKVRVPISTKPNQPYMWSSNLITPIRGYELQFPRQNHALDARHPFVYGDRDAAFYIRPIDRGAAIDADVNKQDLKTLDELSIVPYMSHTTEHAPQQPAPANHGVVLQLAGGENPMVQRNMLPSLDTTVVAAPTHRASLLYHPFATLFMQQVRRHGVEGILDPEVAEQVEEADLVYQELSEALPHPYFNEIDAVAKPAPVEDIDFDYSGAYSVYNWELFFHIPMYIADRLMAERRFAEAQKWLGYVFNPIRKPESIVDSECDHYWRIRPFREAAAKMSIDDLLELLHHFGDDDVKNTQKTALIAQIAAWRTDPFAPHHIARMRPTAYMRAVVMKYLDNLIAWGDDLFRQDTRESTQEAVQLYILALQLLGKRPREVDADERPDKTYDEAAGIIDDFSNFLVSLENDMIDITGKWKGLPVDFKAQLDYQANYPNDVKYGYVPPKPKGPPLLGVPKARPRPHIPKSPFNPLPLSAGEQDPVEGRLYFCIPPNTQLLAYWDTVADRLFKLRNCLNLEGIRRDLALLDPPIDPGLLAKAAAQGVDIATAISNLNAPLPNYRFLVHLGIAKEFAGQVAALGGALLQALEKRDGEALAVLRASHELDLLRAARAVRQRAVDEARKNIDALELSRTTAEKRETYYLTREPINTLELAEREHMTEAKKLDKLAGGFNVAATVASAFPDVTIGISGFSGSPVATATVGGRTAAAIAGGTAAAVGVVAGTHRTNAVISGTKAAYKRRVEEWVFQAQQARAEIDQIDGQITAARIREQIALAELTNHDLQAARSAEALEVMQSKYTNEELYAWMSGELSKLHHHAYKLAVDLARRSERCYRHEIADDSTDFIQFGHWDNRRQGLLAGERLGHDLRRMEAAYYEKNRREYELTKRVSLASIDPVALVQLRKTGACHFFLPEMLFDLDHPSHFHRRIKMVGVTLPAVTGPYTTLGATLIYESGALRPAPGGPSPVASGPAQAWAISTAQDDAGMFEPNLRDERYLPFEGRGLVDSSWRLELPAKVRQFDYETISDVILTIRYTAREGGSVWGDSVQDALAADALAGFTRADAVEEPERGAGQVHMYSARSEFPEAFRGFIAAGSGGGAATLELDLSEQRFPHPQLPPGGRTIEFVALFVRWPADDEVAPDPGSDVFLGAELQPHGGDAALGLEFGPYKLDDPDTGARYNYVWLAQTATDLGKEPGEWALHVPGGWPAGKDPEDVLVLVQYTIS
ncbi:neuraminidase-like domain-containing protein [Nannocystis sp. ILAH1]|uniref:Tc toxin subunit A-related protein n=1 Tax=Nannocystis sp. ILAH1 TaxID=2996789 RepID=UPI002270F2D7|nr:neuraminidase-like domain-containing protein [Nannocystis sp. ILAH1]MCY0989022.1 neuraminidase-like domain-containing protein [Nannocystis sp. ILAH1]